MENITVNSSKQSLNNVSIGENTIINYSILRDAIIGSYSELENAVLHHSVIGSDASLHGLSQSLNLGDSTEIDFGWAYFILL